MKITGNHPTCVRVITGLYSLDRAFINHLYEIGVPVGVGYEIFGATGIGKSTFSYSLAGKIAAQQGSNIVLCDFEGFDSSFLSKVMSSVGFDGELAVQSNPEDEKQLMMSLSALEDKKKDFHVLLLDSVSAITPISEQEGEIGEANMGRRALAMAQFSRKSLHIFRFAKHPKTIIAINHWRPKIGSMGYESPGGVIKNYLFTVRILLKRTEEFPDGSYILQGKVEKNRWGYSDRMFYVFMLAGYGLHTGLTSVWDCITNKVASYKNGVVWIGETSYGRLSTLVKAAKAGEDVFTPFKEALEKLNGSVEDTGTEPETDRTGELDEVQD